jgi:hypothetical protein
MAVDGLNAFLFDGQLPHLYPPNTALRLATGLGAGFGLALLALPVAAGVVWPNPDPDPVIADLVEMAAGLAATAVLGGLILVGTSPLLWPIALAMLLGVLAAFGTANVYLLALLTRRPGAEILPALGLTLLEIAGLAGLRAWLAGFGVSWGA